MSTDEHKVLKRISIYEIKRILSDYMKALNYKPLIGSGGDIKIQFLDSADKPIISINKVEFEVQDAQNPEPEAVWFDKSEIKEIVAKAQRIDLKTHTIHIR
jgi:hypothetical protein